MQLLRSRSINPRVHGERGKEKLVILPDEVDGGRTVGPQYFDRAKKLEFMDRHGIDASIISIANPWLDFLSPAEAVQAAKEANADLEEWCRDESQDHASITKSTQKSGFQALLSPSSRIRSFGILPFSQAVSSSELVTSLEGIAQSKYLKGAIIGTRGRGKGLDDPELEPLWDSAQKLEQPLFLHPHYGVGSDSVKPDGLFGTMDNGHVLPLALGFPFETASAATRLILSGVFDRYPSLQIILAHSGGALPVLSSRLASCITHDPLVCSRLQHDARFYLGKFLFDAVCYGREELEFVARIVGRSYRYKRGASAQKMAKLDEVEELRQGASRFMIGTDHPFFPPTDAATSDTKQEQPLWTSMTANVDAIEAASSLSPQDKAGILGSNAARLFNIA